MEFNQTFYILIGQSLFFIVILALCLKLAVNKHRSHLKQIAEQINKATASQNEEGNKKQSSRQIRELLMKKIQQLQTKNTALEKIEVQHEKLKEKYESLRLNLLKRPGESLDPNHGPVDKLTKSTAGVTTESKKERFLRKMKSVSDASGATDRASHQVGILRRKNADQCDTIEILRAKIKRYDIECDLNAIQIEKKDAALKALDELESALLESQETTEKLEVNLEKLQRDLNKSQQEVDRLENILTRSESDSVREKKLAEKKSYTLISKDSPDEYFDEERDLFELEAIQNYHVLKKEVQRLRSSTSEQRSMIFSLESELISLRKELEMGGLSQEDQEEKEVQLVKLEKLLEETEGCVGMLENEIEYLQERIDSMSSGPVKEKADKDLEADDTKAEMEEVGLTQEHESKELECVRDELENASFRLNQENKVRHQLAEAISAVAIAELDSKLRVVATHVLETLESFGGQVHVKIFSQHGDLDVTNSDKISSAAKSGLTGVLKQSAASKTTEYDVIESNQELLVAHKKIGTYIKTEQKSHDQLEQVRVQVEYVLVVADSIVTTIEDGRALLHQKTVTQHLIERVKKNISTRALHRKHQSTEANGAVNDFLEELLTSLQMMNLTENQSKFFEEMINEIKERMHTLFEAEVTVDAAFTKFIDKLDRDENQSADQA